MRQKEKVTLERNRDRKEEVPYFLLVTSSIRNLVSGKRHVFSVIYVESTF